MMDGIESFHCPLCNCKTTVDFTAYLTEQAQRIADLESATRRLVEALEWALRKLDRGDGVLEYNGPIEDGNRAKVALADPVLVALRREL